MAEEESAQLSMTESQRRIEGAAQRSMLARKKILEALAAAADALVEADDAAAGRAPTPTPNSLSSELPGADRLMVLLSRPSSLPAPTEVRATAQAILQALNSAEELDTALELLAEDRSS